MKMTVAITVEDKIFSFGSLHAVEIELINTGNIDRKSFTFGLNLPYNQRAIWVGVKAPDRHHEVVQKAQVTPSEPASELDFTLSPFTRRDEYRFTLYMEMADESVTEEIQLSSPEAVRLAELQGVADIIQSASVADIAFASLKELIGFRLIR